MSDVSHPDLVRAFELIEREEHSQARILLDAYLESYPRDADAWWLYAHAVNDPMDAQDALRHVLKLDPQYPGARDLLNESEQALIPRPMGGISRLSPRPSPMEQDEVIPDFLNRLDDEGDEFRDDEFDTDGDAVLTAAAGDQRRRSLFILAAALVTVLLISATLILLNMSRQPTNVTSTTPTSVVSNSTVFPTTDVASTSSIDVTQRTGSTDFATIYTALSDFEVIGESATIETTSLGTTFLISVCNDPRGNLVKTTTDVLNRIAQQSASLIGTADFIGARILNCQRDNLVLRTLAASITDAQAFAEGSLSVMDFQTRLQLISN